MNQKKIDEYKQVQTIAKKVLGEIPRFINRDSTEKSIAKKCFDLLKEYGIIDTWYYDCPAYVLLGSRSCLSISGKDYIPATEPVGDVNLVTIDLSPLSGKIWGDCARSFVIQSGGVVVEAIDSEFLRTLNFEIRLHNEMMSFVNVTTTFEELFNYINIIIEENYFVNLDFLNNLGHSIAVDKHDRLFIEKGNTKLLSSVDFFTFEPHVKFFGDNWGFKLENIYYFDKMGRILEL